MRKVASRAARISKRTVEAAAKEAERYTLWDTDLKGFGLRVAPSGVKTFIARYRVGGGRRGVLRQQVIGRFGTLTAEEAREQARLILADAAKGFDPQARKAAARDELTVSELCDLYLEEGCETKKASTLYVDKSRIARHIKPLLGDLKLSAVQRSDVERMMRDVGAGKVRSADAPRALGGKPAASRSVSLLNSIFTFAVGRKLMADNPAKGVKRYKDTKRERFLSPAELGRLGETMSELEAAGFDPVPLNIIRLLALTGARKNEIVRLRWSEIDPERGMLRLVDSKTGAKVIQLGAAAHALLSEQVQGESPYVFSDPRDPSQPYHAIDFNWRKVRDSAQLPGVRVHDLRHTFASVGAPSGLLLLGKLLGHSVPATTSRYAHLADDPVKAAADKIAAQIDGALKGRNAEVRPIKGAR